MTAASALLGGLGLFLLGTWMMTEGLKIAAGHALRSILDRWTRTALRGLLAGVLITSVVRSSSAVTVATIGFVNAGLLTLGQAVWVVFGTNVGTTTTGWLVALVGIRFDIGALALPMLGVGMLLRLVAGAHARRAGLGQALAGFGVFFLGISVLQEGFSDLAPRLAALPLESAGWVALLAFVLLGTVLTVLTQSSSAAIAVTLTASAGGAVPLDLAAAAVVGTNIGTTSTALLAAIGATPPARRVAAAHIVFNVVTGLAALALFPLLLAASSGIAVALHATADTPTVLAVFHTMFNVLGVALMWPAAGQLIRLLGARFTGAEEALGRPRHLDATLLGVPAVARQGLERETARLLEEACDLARQRVQMPAMPGLALAATQLGVLALARAVREFVAQLNASPLPADVAEAMPHVLRAVQHAETIATTSGSLGETAGPAARVATHEQWGALRGAVLAALDPVGGRPEAAVAEAAYQDRKRALLRDAAIGRVPLATMDAALQHAQLLRRIADAAVKARRRLHALGEGTPPAAPEPELVGEDAPPAASPGS